MTYEIENEDELKLNNATNDIELFNFNNKEFIVKVVNIYDGDTFTGCFIYNNEIIKYKFRTLGYDSPEIKPLKSKENRELEIEKAKEARKKFIEYSDCENNLIKVKCDKFDKYGRILATVYNRESNINVNELMIKNNFGYPYYGGKKKC